MIVLLCLFYVETSPAEHRDSCTNDLKNTGELLVLLDQSRFCAEIHHMSLVKQEVLQAMVSELETHPAFASHVSKFELQCVFLCVFNFHSDVLINWWWSGGLNKMYPLSYDSWNKPPTTTLTSITVKENNALIYECHDVILWNSGRMRNSPVFLHWSQTTDYHHHM